MSVSKSPAAVPELPVVAYGVELSNGRFSRFSVGLDDAMQHVALWNQHHPEPPHAKLTPLTDNATALASIQSLQAELEQARERIAFHVAFTREAQEIAAKTQAESKGAETSGEWVSRIMALAVTWADARSNDSDPRDTSVLVALQALQEALSHPPAPTTKGKT